MLPNINLRKKIFILLLIYATAMLSYYFVNKEKLEIIWRIENIADHVQETEKPFEVLSSEVFGNHYSQVCVMSRYHLNYKDFAKIAQVDSNEIKNLSPVIAGDYNGLLLKNHKRLLSLTISILDLKSISPANQCLNLNQPSKLKFYPENSKTRFGEYVFVHLWVQNGVNQ